MKQNKGFSLVELMVVILIIGVIGVILAPQVMKWVDEARKSADYQAKDDILAVAQVAVADYRGEGGVLEDESYNITSSGVTVSSGLAEANSGMISTLEYYMNGVYPQVRNESGKVFQIQLHNSGKKIIVSTVSGTY